MSKEKFIEMLRTERKNAYRFTYGTEGSKVVKRLDKSLRKAERWEFLPHFLFGAVVVEPLCHFLAVEASKAYLPPQDKPPRMWFWLTKRRQAIRKHVYQIKQAEQKACLISIGARMRFTQEASDLEHLHRSLSVAFENPFSGLEAAIEEQERKNC